MLGFLDILPGCLDYQFVYLNINLLFYNAVHLHNLSGCLAREPKNLDILSCCLHSLSGYIDRPCDYFDSPLGCLDSLFTCLDSWLSYLNRLSNCLGSLLHSQGNMMSSNTRGVLQMFCFADLFSTKNQQMDLELLTI